MDAELDKVRSVAANSSIVLPWTVSDTLNGPAETPTAIELSAPVASRLARLADEFALIPMTQALAEHFTVQPKSTTPPAKILTPPAALESTRPDEATVTSVATDRSMVPACTVPVTVMGPDDTSAVTKLEDPVASKFFMLAAAAAFRSMLHEVAVH